MSNQCNTTSTPKYSIVKNKTSLDLNVELPGIIKQDAKITAEENIVTIEAARKNNIPEEWQLINQTSLIEDYKLTLEIDKSYNLASTKATFENGILTLSIEKHASVLPREINILN